MIFLPGLLCWLRQRRMGCDRPHPPDGAAVHAFAVPGRWVPASRLTQHRRWQLVAGCQVRKMSKYRNVSQLVIFINCHMFSMTNFYLWRHVDSENVHCSSVYWIKPYVPRGEPRRDPSNRRLYEHGIYIYLTLPGLELATCSVASTRCFL